MKYDLEHLEAFKPGSMGAKDAFDLIEASTNFFDEKCEKVATVRSVLRTLLTDGYHWRMPIIDGLTGHQLETFANPIIEIKD